MRNWLLCILILASSYSQAQYQRYLEQGDKSRDKLQLNGALLKYLKAYEDSSSTEICKRIGDTYYDLREWDKAEKWYYLILSFPDQQPEDYINYITCLAFLGKEAKSVEFMGYLNDYFSDFTIDPKYKFWLEKKFRDPCTPDKTKNSRISYCVEFDISGSIDPENPGVDFFWKFDDGFEKKGVKLKHCFRQAGNHEVTLSAIDSSLGHARVFDSTFTVSFVEEANFKVNGNTSVGRPVNFYAYNLRQHPDYYGMVWEISDGTLHYKEAFVHEFYQPGTYGIILHVFGKNANGEIYTVACLTQDYSIKRGD